MLPDQLQTSKDLDLIKDGNTYYLLMNQQENKCDTDWIKRFNDCLDIAESSSGPGCLVTVGTGPNVFHTGFDLDAWRKDPISIYENFQLYALTISRILTFPMATMAVINGDAVRSGWFLAMAHDQRIMSEDKGFISLGEVDIGLSIPEGWTDMAAKVVAPQTFRQIMYGDKFGPTKAKEMKLINSTYKNKIDMVEQIKRFENEYAQKAVFRQSIKETKQNYFKDVCHKLQKIPLSLHEIKRIVRL